MTPGDIRDEIAKRRLRRDNPEPLNLPEPAEYARRFPVTPQEELDRSLGEGII